MFSYLSTLFDLQSSLLQWRRVNIPHNFARLKWPLKLREVIVVICYKTYYKKTNNLERDRPNYGEGYLERDRPKDGGGILGTSEADRVHKRLLSHFLHV